MVLLHRHIIVVVSPAFECVWDNYAFFDMDKNHIVHIYTDHQRQQS